MTIRNYNNISHQKWFNSLKHVNVCVVCGEKISLMDRGQVTHKPQICSRIYKSAFQAFKREAILGVDK